jgi:cellulose synthase/poly-beta-1,6-N-acetylglucosamine synthase-like glycosyltransferase
MSGLIFWICVSGILYTHLGYPVLVFLLARVKRRPIPQPDATPSVTLLIAAYNEDHIIGRKIENSLELDYPADRLQILVVTDGSDDATPQVVEQYADRGVELAHEAARGGKMAAIERAMPLATGSIVVLSDGNNMFDRSALRELVIPFADSEVGVVTGAKTIQKGDGSLGESEGLYWRYESFIRVQESLIGCCTGVNGEILAIRRDAFRPLPYAGIGAVDFHLSMQIVRAGYRIAYAPLARSYERISVSAEDEKERRARIVAGRYQAMSLGSRVLMLDRPLVAWQVVSHKFMRALVPLFMLGALIANILAVLLPPAAEASLWLLPAPANWVGLGLQGAFYGLAAIGTRFPLEGRLGRLLYLPTFFVNSNQAALVGLARFALGRQTPLWKRVPRREVG